VTTSKFLLTGLCPGTDVTNPRAVKALAAQQLFPLIIEVRIVGDLQPCSRCGAKRYKLTTESQANTERIFGFESTKVRTVCESMGYLIK